MLRNQKGISVYAILSVILFAALIFVLALPYFYNLDKDKNVDDCTTNMKSIWVAATDFVRDNRSDFGGDLNVLRNTPKASDPKSTYLAELTYCPETHREKNGYIVFGKYEEEMINEEVKQNTGVIVICPNLENFPKHFLGKAFYENMSPTNLQNYMIDDLDWIDQQTKSNGARKFNAVMRYIEIWKTDRETFAKRKADSTVLKKMIFPEAFPSAPDMGM
ncbi:MAG: hypothetical protein U1B83_04860 [Candidatus Cloacimonadaceae bacterium]|nr:hypothetical protein [Candidatus Cloacimonadaceae bacterium]